MSDMPRPRPPYLHREITRHGRAVWYYRKPGGKRVRIAGEYGSREFHEAYRVAAGLAAAPAPYPARPSSGTLRWLCAAYMGSASFVALAPATQATRRRILTTVCQEAGDAPLVKIGRKAIVNGREKRAGAPNQANAFVKTMRALFGWAVEAGHVELDPTEGVKLIRVRTSGHHTWTRTEVEAYRAAHPLGTKARLALEILLYTGLRTCDAVRLGPQHAAVGTLELPSTRKTGAAFAAPILPTLAAALAAGPSGHLCYLVTDYGQPFSVKGFGQWFRKQAKRARVPGTAHGLRKAGATYAAEEGASERELMALYGWTSSKTAAIYTAKADKKRLAASAARRIETGTAMPAPLSRVRAPGRKSE